MPITTFVSRLLEILNGARRQRRPNAPLADWPLPNAIPVLLLAAPAELPLQYRGGRQDIQIFTYPFEQPELVTLVVTLASPDVGAARDGKYCEFIAPDRSIRYFSCRLLVDHLEEAERTAGRGMSRLRWVALDQFGYAEEAAALYRSFEEELGPTMAATGLARIMMNRRPRRAMALIEDARRRGIGCAALTACHARVLFACGKAPEGIRVAALALTQLPDPFWNEADHLYSWGLLRGAATASRLDARLQPDVIAAIHLLTKSPASTHRVLACAELLSTAGDATAAAHQATTALALAASAEKPVQDIAAIVQRARAIAEGTTRRSTEPSPANTSVPESDSTLFHTAPPADEVMVTLGSTFDGPDLADVTAVRNYCRQSAEASNAALVEANVVETPAGAAIQMIYKTPAGSGFLFTGLQLTPVVGGTRICKVVAAETGTTGVREAIVTTHLMQEGRLNVKTYQSSWGCDPYDATYRAPANLPLRFTSDDPVYDRMFPGHPLTRVRRALQNLSEGAQTVGR